MTIATVDDQNLGSIQGVSQALARVPGGVEAARLMARLGMWTSPAHNQISAREKFPHQFSNLGSAELSDLSAKWASESGRIVELVGLLTGIEMQLKVRAKSARASSRALGRRNWPDDKKAPTKAELDDLAEEDQMVKDLDDQLGLIGLLLAQAGAVKEANQLFKEAVSREITYRVAQMNGRMY